MPQITLGELITGPDFLIWPYLCIPNSLLKQGQTLKADLGATFFSTVEPGKLTGSQGNPNSDSDCGPLNQLGPSQHEERNSRREGEN